MPLNLLKKYNQILILLDLNEFSRKESLMNIFNRDIRSNDKFVFNNKKIYPTPHENGEISMGNLFNHLTRKEDSSNEKNRTFDLYRSERLHWIRYHIEKNKKENMLYFSVKEPRGIRTYIYDKDEKYVVILEPLRNKEGYYLLTAYPLLGKDKARNSIMKKYKRKLENIF